MTEQLQTTAATTEATTESVTTPVTQEGTTTIDLFTSLNDDMKQIKSLEKFKGKDINELAKSYTNLEELIGKKVSDMPEDVVKQFLKVPTTPDKYVLADDATTLVSKDMLALAQKNNISQDQLKALTDLMVQEKRMEASKIEEEANRILSEQAKILDTEFGAAKEKRLEAVEKVLTQYGSKELKEYLTKTGTLHDAQFIKFLDKVTQDVLQVKMVGADYNAQLSLTPQEAKTKIAQKYTDKEFTKAYFDPFHANHKSAVEEMIKLNDFAGNA